MVVLVWVTMVVLVWVTVVGLVWMTVVGLVWVAVVGLVWVTMVGPIVNAKWSRCTHCLNYVFQWCVLAVGRVSMETTGSNCCHFWEVNLLQNSCGWHAHMHTMHSHVVIRFLPHGLCVLWCHPGWIVLCYLVHFLTAVPLHCQWQSLLSYVCHLYQPLWLLPLETVYRVLQCVNASCDRLVTSVEALPHRGHPCPLSLPMYACQSAVPDKVTGGPATRGSQPLTQVGGILVYHNMPILSALPTITACIPLALLHSV